MQCASNTEADVEIKVRKGSKRANGRPNAFSAATPASASDNMAPAVVGCPCLPIGRDAVQTVEIAILDPLRDIAVHVE